MKKCMPQIIDIQQEQKDSLLNQKEKKTTSTDMKRAPPKYYLNIFISYIYILNFYFNIA